MRITSQHFKDHPGLSAKKILEKLELKKFPASSSEKVRENDRQKRLNSQTKKYEE